MAVFECDEEDGSHGIISSLTELKRLRDVHRFDYVAAINADFVSPRYNGDPNRYIYKGTVGKLLPSFFITGFLKPMWVLALKELILILSLLI